MMHSKPPNIYHSNTFSKYLRPKSKLATNLGKYTIYYLYIDICSFGKWNCLVIVWEHMVDPQHTKPLFFPLLWSFSSSSGSRHILQFIYETQCLALGLAAAFFKLGNFLLFCRRRAPSAASPPRRLSVLRLLLVNHTLKIGGEIMADAPTNLMAKYILCTRVIWRLQQSVSQYIYDGNFWNT